MSDLNLGPPSQSGLAKYLGIAAVVLALIAAAVVWFNPHHVSELAVESTQLFSPHTKMKSPNFGFHVIGQPDSVEDNLYVVTTVRFKNTLRLPIDPMGASAQMIDKDGSEVDGSLIAQRDLPRLNGIFPQLAPMTAHPLSLDRLEPGETRDGTLVLLFSGTTDQDWKAKKSAVLTIRLAQQPAQTTPLP